MADLEYNLRSVAQESQERNTTFDSWVTFGGTKTACSLEQNGALTYQRPVEEQRHPDERADAESQDEGPPPAPAQGAAVAGRADQRGEHEAEDGAEEPRQAVVLLRKTCTHKKTKTKQDGCYGNRFWVRWDFLQG